MIIIADSGSTKTEWSLISPDGAERRIFTQGINPYFTTNEAIEADLRQNLLPELRGASVESVYFYGAGCAQPDKCAVVSSALSALFSDARIEVASDLLGACRSLLGGEAGIAGILGTGSNSCFYDGRKIIANVPPLGFILGDEGSGAHLGKLLAGDVVKRQLPPEVCEAFFEETHLTSAEIVERVYRAPYPSRFLASLAPFVGRYIGEPSLRQMAKGAFTAFLRRNVMNYDYRTHAVSLTGGVAYHFADLIREAADELGVRVGRITKAPMEGLIAYHR